MSGNTIGRGPGNDDTGTNHEEGGTGGVVKKIRSVYYYTVLQPKQGHISALAASGHGDHSHPHHSPFQAAVCLARGREEDACRSRASVEEMSSSVWLVRSRRSVAGTARLEGIAKKKKETGCVHGAGFIM